MTSPCLEREETSPCLDREALTALSLSCRSLSRRLALQVRNMNHAYCVAECQSERRRRLRAEDAYDSVARTHTQDVARIVRLQSDNHEQRMSFGRLVRESEVFREETAQTRQEHERREVTLAMLFAWEIRLRMKLQLVAEAHHLVPQDWENQLRAEFEADYPETGN